MWNMGDTRKVGPSGASVGESDPALQGCLLWKESHGPCPWSLLGVAIGCGKLGLIEIVLDMQNI